MFRSVFCWRLVKTLNPHRRSREKPSKHDDGVPGLLPVGLYALALPESSPRPSVTIPHAKTELRRYGSLRITSKAPQRGLVIFPLGVPSEGSKVPCIPTM